MKELSSNLYGICAGCLLLILSPFLGALRLLKLGTYFSAQVGCATDDEFVPFAALPEFAVKTFKESLYCLGTFYERRFVKLLLFAVDKHLANRMDLINKNLLNLKTDLAVKSMLKQDPQLIAAIDKLHNVIKISEDKSLLLPERKLNFSEVEQLLKQTPLDTGKDKTPDDFVKEEQDKRKIIMKKIENLLENINKSAKSGDIPKLIIRNQRLWSNCVYDLDRVALKEPGSAKTTIIQYSKAEDRSRFNTIVFVLSRVHELLAKNMTITRRELYYQNVGRFRSQGALDAGVRDACCVLQCPPWALGLAATAKGLVAGPLQITRADGALLDCSSAGGTLIPQDIHGIKEFKSTAKYILVVEKDAVFQKLLDEGCLERLQPVIILTGKGYPDVCTRQLLRRLVSELRLKALALVDADPHGYEIFLTYKYGSLAQSHLSATLACPQLLLLGARHQDVMTLAPKTARLALTALDRRKLKALLARPYLNSVAGSRIKAELNAMLESGVKAEIEALAPSAAALCDSYLPSKIIQAEYLG